MGERIRAIRNAKKMNQADFAKSLGMGQSTLAMMEVGKREILDRHIKTICATYGVNEEWLRHGTGETFTHSDDQIVDDVVKRYGLDDFAARALSSYMKLSPANRAVIKDYLISIAASYFAEVAKELAPDVTIDGKAVDDPDVAKELASYKDEIEAEKRVTEKSSVSPNIKDA